MSTNTVKLSQLTLATPAAADHVAGSNAAGLARRFAVGELGTAHTHGIATVSGLQAALDGKASLAATNVLRVETVNGLNGAITIEEGSGINVATQGSKITLSAAAPPVSSVNAQTGTVVLTSLSVSAASAVHTHVISDVTGLQSALDAKAAGSATNVARVVSLAGVSGTLTLTGVNLTIATAVGEITLTAATPGGVGNVASVNGQTGTVVLTHASVSAAAASHAHDASDVTSGTFDAARIPTHTHTIAQVSGLQTSLDGKAGTSHASQHRAGGSDVVLPVTTSTTITANANNLTLPTGDIIRLSSTATGTAVITGLSGGAANQVRLLCNVSTNAIRLAHASSDSGATNRFAIAGGADLDLAEGAQVSAWYDADTQRWRVAAGSASTGAGSTATGGIVSVNGYTATAVTLTSTDVSAASAVHTHTTASITGLDSHIAGQATNAQVVWSLNGITGVVVITHTSVSAAAASHTHVPGDIAGFADAVTAANVVRSLNGMTGAVTLTSVGVSAASASHTHVISDVTGLQSALDGKAAASATAVTRVVSLNGLTDTVTIVGVNLTVATAAGQITLTAPAAGGGGGGGGIVSVNGQTATAVVLTHTDVSASPVNPVVTAVSLTASVNNYSLPTGDILRLSNTTTNNVNITGFGTAVDGASRLLLNVSTGASSTYTIKHQDTNSTAVSRVIVPWAGDYIVSPNGGAALIIYDDTDDRWRVV